MTERWLDDLTVAVHRGESLDEWLAALDGLLRGRVPFNRLALGLLDAAGEKLSLSACRSDGPEALKVGYADPLAGSTLEALFRTGRVRPLNDLPAYLAGKPESRSTRLLVREGMRANLTVPLRVDGRPIGAMFFASRRTGSYDETHVELMGRLANHLAVAATQARRFGEMLNQPLISPPERGLIGDSAAMRAVRQMVERVAATDGTVLITGETGTGKELVARAIHAASPRRERPLVAVHCAALSPGLIASELFGHEAGAFTGAVKRRIGQFESAGRGSVFLDEVAEIPRETQVMLLRVLQERVVERVGGDEPIPVPARVIAAANRDLGRAVVDGEFRADLYYRLNVLPIHVPPLRERREDIPLLVEHFVRRTGKAIRGPDERGMRLLCEYPWPGNVREMQHLIERAVVMSDGRELSIDPAWLDTPCPPAGAWADRECQAIRDAFRQSSGKVYGPGGAAAWLGLRPTTLYGKMRKHGIDPREMRG